MEHFLKGSRPLRIHQTCLQSVFGIHIKISNFLHAFTKQSQSAQDFVQHFIY